MGEREGNAGIEKKLSRLEKERKETLNSPNPVKL